MSEVDEIKQRLDIAEVIGDYVRLTKAGKNYKGISPFTREKTPSFFVSPEKGMFYCFSSNQGGDIFTFIQKMEKVEFSGALKILAERAGVELRKSPQKNDGRDRSYQCLEAASRFFQKSFVQDKEALDYLRGRGISAETMKTFRIGLAPSSWQVLLEHLREQGFSGSEVESVGLAIARDSGGHYDRFRGRIMFPITDTAGRVVGFSGRALDGDAQAKYINTPETELYHKSEVLYGFAEGKSAIRSEGSVVLVEGQMDVLASHQAGVKNVLAVSGTGLSEKQLSLIGRFSDRVVIALDADAAGSEAADKSARMALSHGLVVEAVELEAGTDPADLVRESPERWRQALERAQNYLDFRIERLVQNTSEEDHAAQIKDALFPHVRAISGAIAADKALAKIAAAVGVTLEAIREEYQYWARSTPVEATSPADQQQANRAAETSDSSETREPKRLRKDEIRGEILALLAWQERLAEPAIDTGLVYEKYEKLEQEFENDYGSKQIDYDSENAAFAAEIRYGELDDLEGLAQELLIAFEIELVDEQIKESSAEIKKQKQHEGDASDELMRQHERLVKRGDTLKSRGK